MQLEILQIGDDRLLKPSKKVANFADKTLQKLVDDMIDTCERGKKYTAGLAAPQVGENIQLTVVRRTDLEKRNKKKDRKKSVKSEAELAAEREESLKLWLPMFNPRVISEDEEYDTLIWEACLSIGKGPKQVYGPVYRPSWVEVEYEDREGQTQRLRGEGFLSHLLQHEIDHLQGVLFTSRVPNPEKNLWLNKDLDAYMKQHGDYPPV